MSFADSAALEDILAAPIAPTVKVRLIVMGLVYCSLDIETSQLFFLRHVGHHALSIRVKGTTRMSGKIVCDMVLYVGKDDAVSLEVSGSKDQGKIEGSGPHQLDKMINLTHLHNGPIVPKGLGTIQAPSIVSVKHCAFFTADIYKAGKFDLTEKPNTGRPISRDIGSVLGGTIRCPTPDSTVTITSPCIPLPNGRLVLLGKAPTGEEIIYDVQLHNECTDKAACEKDATQGNPLGTDFRFYYDILEQQNDVGRHFELTTPPGAVGISACNPVIIFPDEPYN